MLELRLNWSVAQLSRQTQRLEQKIIQSNDNEELLEQQLADSNDRIGRLVVQLDQSDHKVRHTNTRRRPVFQQRNVSVVSLQVERLEKEVVELKKDRPKRRRSGRRTCGELRAADPTLPSGRQTIHADDDAGRPFDVFCDMETGRP